MNNSRSSVSIFLDEEDFDELEDLYCVACDKIFKTLKQKVNIPHTNSFILVQKNSNILCIICILCVSTGFIS